MANAGCINAIGFDGTYLRTLDTLDSANIGVGVQYCIPAPLDDKRLDYIKYTDKCGCTCCITGENEILVYATNGVIKNFTLTNDDTNEKVNVKWNDLFGSNRAYTMVRYKTGSYPTSITDGTLAVKETTQNQYSVSGYNVSGLTDGTTYYFTAFAVSQDGTIIVVQNKNITTDFWRSSYRIDTTTLFGTFDIGNTANYGLCVSEDGQYLYVGNNASPTTVKQYRMSTPFDIRTAVSTGKTVSGVNGQHGVYISPNGLKLYAIGHDNSSIKEYTMTTPHDLSTATGTNVSLPVNGGTGISFSDDGLYAFISNFSKARIYKIHTSTPFTLSGNTLTKTQEKYIGRSPRGIGISSDGLHIYMGYNRNLSQRNMTSKEDISTASSAYSKGTPATNDNNYCGNITKDGKYLFYIYNDRYVARLDFTKA